MITYSTKKEPRQQKKQREGAWKKNEKKGVVGKKYRGVSTKKGVRNPLPTMFVVCSEFPLSRD